MQLAAHSDGDEFTTIDKHLCINEHYFDKSIFGAVLFIEFFHGGIEKLYGN